MSFRQSDSFNQNRVVWTIFGLWPGKIPVKYYQYFSCIYLMVTCVIYNILLTLNLYYTPRKIDLINRELIFFFTEIAIVSKMCMVLFKRKKLEAIFGFLDCEEFQGSDEIGKQIVEKHNKYYKTYLMFYTIFNNISYCSYVLLPVIGFISFGYSLTLPICQYYFLSDETRNDYFTFIYIYQTFGMYNHMMYNANNDTLIVGFMVLAVGQVKVLCHDLENLKTEKSVSGDEETDYKQRAKLRKIVHHYNLLLQYCADFQEVIDGAIFVQFGVGSACICVVMFGFLVPSTMETYMFLVSYGMAMLLEIFVPAWLGTQLSYGSQELMVSAYKSEWLPRSKQYKSSIILFVERAKHPVVITGLKIFPLSLATYITIMRAAYSCFTMFRMILNRQDHAMH